MSDYIVLQFLVFAGIVAGAYYHGFKIGVSEGAGNMYDYLKDRGKKGKKWTTVRLLNEPENGAQVDISDKDK
jgi:hypothetical protein